MPRERAINKYVDNYSRKSKRVVPSPETGSTAPGTGTWGKGTGTATIGFGNMIPIRKSDKQGCLAIINKEEILEKFGLAPSYVTKNAIVRIGWRTEAGVP